MSFERRDGEKRLRWARTVLLKMRCCAVNVSTLDSVLLN